MKLAVVVIFALVCHLAIGDNTTNTTTTVAHKYCETATQFWNGTGCTDCPAGCATCVYKNKSPSCTNCKEANMFLQITNDIGSCAKCIDHCSLCRGPNALDCIKPAANYSVNPVTKSLVACDKANCQYCNADGSCAECKYHFHLSNGTCSACSVEHCANCSASASNCTKCMASFALVDNTCKKCSDGCEICAPGTNGSAPTCSLCLNDYDLTSNKTCYKHSCDTTEHCEQCDANHVCTKCKETFFVDKAKNNSCAQCGTNCAECTSATQCTMCIKSDPNDFHRISLNNGACNKCTDASCETCDATGKCTKCQDYFFLQENATCAKCGPYCKTCTSAGCTQCLNAGFKILTNGSCMAYSTCKEGEQLDAAGNCSAGTIENCKRGDAAAKNCYECAAGYYPEGTGCSPCPNGCETCSKNSSGYLQCGLIAAALQETGFAHLTNSTTKQDSTGYLCHHDCSKCTSSKSCTHCMPHYVLSKSIINQTHVFCLPYNTCPHPVEGSPVIDNGLSLECFTDNANHTKSDPSSSGSSSASGGSSGKNAAKLAMTFIASIVAALFAF